jgi:preprotein translocase subunit SecA
MKAILTKVFGSRNDRLLKKMNRDVTRINALEDDMQQLADGDFAEKTKSFRARLEQGETTTDLLPEAFAMVREASRRVLGLRHYDVQMIGGMVLNSGRVAEMKTGEGKTLVATLAAYLNALPGKGVHVVTVNDYLARRDAEWMGKLYNFLGLSVGTITSDMGPNGRDTAYAADITYGTNNEFGFDYLRDNMAFSARDRVQRGHAFAVVDEVDSILIDEARTPLIISGPTDDQSELYQLMNAIAPRLEKQEGDASRVEKGEENDAPGDYAVNEKDHQVLLTEAGYDRVESMLVEEGALEAGDSLYDPGNILIMHHLYAALRAYALFQRNVHYIVKNNQIIIVDEFTGRTMPGRRWSDGLHQAIEAKEGVPIQNENQTMASITFQNYFRLYEKLSGMTGTADTEAYELQQIYGLEVVVIPPNKPMVRKDLPDQIYLTQREKFNAVVKDIQGCLERGQPVLVGTASIEASEYLSSLLDKEKIKHEVLNAKQHEREAHIIEQAGVSGSVTIATNMAGRGTDIMLGGSLDAMMTALGDEPSSVQVEEVKLRWQHQHDAVLESGGLHIIGSERHESRRIDNQLRGRAGRQGDPGSSRFYLSLEDNLMRIFASEKLGAMMQKLGMEEGEAIEHRLVSRAIENAQRKVEGHNFDIRKQVLEYDDVANDQRKVVYEQRNELMDTDDVSESIEAIREDVADVIIDEYIAPESLEEQWDVLGLEAALKSEYELEIPVAQWLDEDHDLHEETLRRRIVETLQQHYQNKVAQSGEALARHYEKSIMLDVLDRHWQEHLHMMDHLRQGIQLRGYAQKNPKEEFKREAFEMFQGMLETIKRETIKWVTVAPFYSEEDLARMEEQRRNATDMEYQHASSNIFAENDAPADDEFSPPQTQRREGRKVGRNEPCPCGSGKKYKHCHGKLK